MDLNEITINFIHPAYQFAPLFAKRETGIKHFQSWTIDDAYARMGDGDVVVGSGYWRNDMIETADRLKFIQVCGAGYDAFDQDAIRAKGIRLANASGCNVNAVSDHALALTLGLTRQIHIGRDNQRATHWRGMIADLSQREDELPGKTMLIFGLGKIGGRTARLAKAFGMHVIGIKRNISTPVDHVDELYTSDALAGLLPRCDVVVLTCPITPETRHVIDGPALAAMKPSSYLINVARGACVDEAALIVALRDKQIAGAGIDVTEIEPLAADSPLWAFDNVILTPHTAGETRKYEDNVIDILLENLDRLSKGSEPLHNQVV